MLRKKTAAYALLAIYEIAEQQRGASSPLGVRAGDVADKHHLPKTARRILCRAKTALALSGSRFFRSAWDDKPADVESIRSLK